MVAVPVQVHDTPPSGGEVSDNTWYYWTQTGLYLFELERGEDAHIEPVGSIIATDASDDFGTLRSTLRDRSVIQGDAVHYIHDDQVWSAPWDDPEDAVGPQ